jgi:hypothetical protein
MREKGTANGQRLHGDLAVGPMVLEVDFGALMALDGAIGNTRTR